MDIENATRIFLDYVAGFQPLAADPLQQEKMTPMDVKREHSLRVLENARLLLEGLGFDARQQRLGLLAALFHDIGRFPQYKKYNTFHDPSSVNHGLLGARTLAPAPLGPGLLDALPLEERAIVRAVVAMHNRRKLPKGISSELAELTELVRDADKLDIMRVMLEHFNRGEDDPVITLHVTSHPRHYTREVYDDVFNARQGDYRKLRFSNDFILLLVGWIYDLYYSGSRRLLAQRQYPKQLFALLPDTTAMHELRSKVMGYLEEDRRESRTDALK